MKFLLVCATLFVFSCGIVSNTKPTQEQPAKLNTRKTTVKTSHRSPSHLAKFPKTDSFSDTIALKSQTKPKKLAKKVNKKTRKKTDTQPSN